MAFENEYQEFLTKQESVYQKFRDAREKIKAAGLEMHNIEGKGSYIMAFKHSPRTAERIAQFSTSINNYVPSMVYGQTNAHTTIFDVNVMPNFHPDGAVLREMSKSASRALAKRSNPQPRVIYYSWLINPSTVIAAGVPNREAFEIMDAINQEARKKGIMPRMAWGAHITAARFATSVEPGKTQSLLQEVDSTSPLGEITLDEILVGHFNATSRDFNLTAYEIFRLEKY